MLFIVDPSTVWISRFEDDIVQLAYGPILRPVKKDYKQSNFRATPERDAFLDAESKFGDPSAHFFR